MPVVVEPFSDATHQALPVAPSKNHMIYNEKAGGFLCLLLFDDG